MTENRKIFWGPYNQNIIVNYQQIELDYAVIRLPFFELVHTVFKSQDVHQSFEIVNRHDERKLHAYALNAPTDCVSENQRYYDN